MQPMRIVVNDDIDFRFPVPRFKFLNVCPGADKGTVRLEDVDHSKDKLTGRTFVHQGLLMAVFCISVVTET